MHSQGCPNVIFSGTGSKTPRKTAKTVVPEQGKRDGKIVNLWRTGRSVFSPMMSCFIDDDAAGLHPQAKGPTMVSVPRMRSARQTAHCCKSNLNH
jgi:hypothetical protein